MADQGTHPVEPLALPALHAVAPSMAGRKLAKILMALFLALPIALLVLPWQQNVAGAGRVIAVDPLDRIQTIPAPVTGRLVDLFVQEGSYVEKGEVLAEMADLDAGFSERLDQQAIFAEEKVVAARESLDFYEQQLNSLYNERQAAIKKAEADLRGAIEKVRSAEQELIGFEAEKEQKDFDRERKLRLFQEGLKSELEFQKSDAEAVSAKAKVESARAKVEEARQAEESKMADIEQVSAEKQAKIDKTASDRNEAQSKVAAAKKERTEAESSVARQSNQRIIAPQPGYILRIHASSSADFISRGEPFIEFAPDVDELAVEFFMRGIDAPLVNPGRSVRLQFEGWPAVQFAGWPSVAVGTFGGKVSVVDAQVGADGRFRVLVTPDPNDDPWPNERFLRQGVRASGWCQLETVKLGYEVWRQLNAFPPMLNTNPMDVDSGKKKGDAKQDDGTEKGSK